MEQLKSVEQFQEIVKKETAVFLFSADWCPDCRVIEPYLPRMEADFPTFNYYYVDRDQFVDLCVDLGIMGIPSFLVYSGGEEIDRFVSKDRKTEEEIEAFLTNAEEKAFK
ncbi:thioredoxin family protein [Alkalihalobacillus pseudalcaliphilus]|uniref:thioredoxin family protein n=1 Tax=Alkalihalobacillus pseudalcaliphilus TaxID=79884 RepID=UPI00064DE4B1|nr:thioredoxin family protein [Alkalihalobacillus pseudalcaliphilus]KMK77805.1 thioredoxin [Alkalihalobacillus pseudalcaliphilus]